MVQANPHAKRSGEVVWRVQYRIDGRVVTDTFDTQSAGDEYASLVERVGGAAARQVLAKRRSGGETVPTLRQWTAQYLSPESGLLTGIEPSTRQNYERIAERSFLTFLGDYPLTAISKETVGQWVAWQEKRPKTRNADGNMREVEGSMLSAKTIKNYHALLSNVLKAAVEGGIIEQNPAFRTRLSAGIAEEPVFLSRDQFARLYSEIPEYYKPLVALLVGTQMRWSEATALQWKHINTDTAPPTIRVSQAWKKPTTTSPWRIGPTKTRRGRRTVSVWNELIALLGEPGSPEDLVIQGRLNGGRLWYGSFLSRIWNTAVERAELNPRPTPHDLRHTGASWLIADGKPLPFIQARLGHESITTTINVYGHLLPDAHTQMADSLAATLSNVVPLRDSAQLEVTEGA